MGFSGGGSNVTKAHTHDSTVVQDGGALAANVTQFGLTNGSILVSKSWLCRVERLHG